MAESRVTKSVDVNRLVSRGDFQYSTYDRLNKAMCLMLILLLIAPMAYTQDPEQRELLSIDRTKRIIDMRGRKARLAAEKMRQGDRDIEQVAQFLQAKGFRPNGNAFVFYSEDTNVPGRYRGLNVEVMFQGFVDDANPDARAIIALARQRNGFLANISALRLDLDGNIIEKYNILRRQGRRVAGIVPLEKKEPMALAKLVALQDLDPNNHPESPDYVEPNPSDFRDFYGCASGACAGGLLLGLFSLPLGPEASAVAFVTACAMGALGCGFVHIGLPYWIVPVPGPYQNPNAPNNSNREAPVGVDDDFGPFPYIPPVPPGCQDNPNLYGPGC